jgi:hypothetical protein
MTTHMNLSMLPPLWMDSKGHEELPTVRTAQAPLLSPSPLSPKTVPSPIYPVPHDGLMRKKARAVRNSLANDAECAGLPNTSSPTSVQGRSPLVFKLEEEASLQLAETAKSDGHISDLKPPTASQVGPEVAETYREIRPRDENTTTRIPDAFIIARSLRRHTSPHTEGSTCEGESGKSKASDHRMLRAVIQPRAGKPVLIQCALDSIKELQATELVKDTAKSPQSASPPKTARKPLPILPKSLSNARRHSTGPPSPKATPRSSDYGKSIRDPIIVPICKGSLLLKLYPLVANHFHNYHSAAQPCNAPIPKHCWHKWQERR